MSQQNDFLRKRAKYEIKLEDNFYEFVREAWEYIDSTPFIDAKHIKIKCDHYQALSEGKFSRLIINEPPGFAKSQISSVLYPVWVWLREPWHQFLTGSHSYSFAVRDSRKSRDLIKSDWFQYLWGDKIVLSEDQNTKGMYQNTAGGYRTVFGVGSGFTGWRAHTILFDDPNNLLDKYSEPKRNEAIKIIDEALENRLHIIGKTALVVIMQRIHREDVTGHILSTNKKDWVHLYMPLVFDSAHRCQTPIYTDDREEGQILWNRIPEEKVRKVKLLSTYNAHYQQWPEADSGTIFFAEYFKYYATEPQFKRIVMSLDAGGKDKKTSDYSAITVWGITDTGYYLIYGWRKQVHYLDLIKTFKDIADKFNPNLALVEDASLGVALIQEIKHTTRIPYKAITAGVVEDKNKKRKTKGLLSKEERAGIVTPIFEAGRVFFPERSEYIHDVKKELLEFPGGKNDDYVDSIVQFLNEENKKSSGPRVRALN